MEARRRGRPSFRTNEHLIMSLAPVVEAPWVKGFKRLQDPGASVSETPTYRTSIRYDATRREDYVTRLVGNSGGVFLVEALFLAKT